MTSYRLLSVVLSDWNMFHNAACFSYYLAVVSLLEKHFFLKEHIEFWNFKNEYLYNWNSSVLIKSKY